MKPGCSIRVLWRDALAVLCSHRRLWAGCSGGVLRFIDESCIRKDHVEPPLCAVAEVLWRVAGLAVRPYATPYEPYELTGLVPSQKKPM